jgi:hypothetical protein
MLEKAALVGLIPNASIKSMGLGALVSAGNFYSGAVMSPAKLLGGTDQGTAHATALSRGEHSQNGDPTRVARGVEERNAVKAEDPGEVAVDVGNEDSVVRSANQNMELGSKEVLGSGIPETCQNGGETRGVRRRCFADNDSRHQARFSSIPGDR